MVTRTNSTGKMAPNYEDMRSKKTAGSTKSETLQTTETETTVKCAKRKNRSCSGFVFVEGQHCMLLRSSSLLKSSMTHRSLRECQVCIRKLILISVIT